MHISDNHIKISGKLSMDLPNSSEYPHAQADIDSTYCID